jgi:hypothetical protein
LYYFLESEFACDNFDGNYYNYLGSIEIASISEGDSEKLIDEKIKNFIFSINFQRLFKIFYRIII